MALLCLSGLEDTCRCRTGAQLGFADRIPAPHWHQEDPSTEMWEAQAHPLFLTQGSGILFRVPQVPRVPGLAV